MPSCKDTIFSALERECEALLAKTYAAFSSYGYVSSDKEEMAPKYDVKGFQAAFHEIVHQRQVQLEFLGKQDAAKRRASRRSKSENLLLG